MDRVAIDLQHCYGINSLKHEFDFTGKPAWALYAPNGVMKSSLAETFYDASQGKKSEDRIFKDRVAVRHITDETGAEIAGERILVIRSYDSEYAPTEKTSTLLVSADLRRESEQLEARVATAKESLLAALRKQSGAKKRDFAEEISIAMMRRPGQFEDAALGLVRVIERQEDAPFADVDYDIVFNDKVLKALDDADLMAAIREFIARYNELLANSNYFRQGTFDYYNAGEIAKTLDKQGFFNAEHTVNLYASGVPVEVKNQKQLMAIIEDEKKAILTEPELAKRFEIVQKKLAANEDLREFQRYLQSHEAVLSKMDNIEAFRQDVLRSYLKANQAEYLDYTNTIESVDVRRKEIIELARQQTTDWDKVLTIFNERFFVPFELSATNKLPVILGQVEKPVLSFKYNDGRESVDISRNDLVKVLSMGERRALYLINVIFELRRRMKDGIKTLVVVDDIADSFDYNNKYAIIQYLQDVSKDQKVKLIIMTHNFDFFRTIESRFVGYKNCLMATKDADHINLIKAAYIRNAPHDWKKNFFRDRRKQIASIAFLRNIIEMTHGSHDPRFLKLTSMLHWKQETSGLTVGDLDDVFNSVCEPTGHSDVPDEKIIDLIMAEADSCVGDGAGLKLENKIVLAIATRLRAESFIIKKINDDAWVDTLTKNQTRELIDRFRNEFSGDEDTLRVLDRVELMTPENIHVNAFMYEPLIDMSDVQLRKLFADVKALA
ncbi:hypothetical protein [Blastomonas fulva]|uniref:hypothetical protein n=1 Tax=Blastomonas fulva TaxID=1550728 RepID=UPI003F6FAA9B